MADHYPHAMKFLSSASVWGIASFIPIFAQSIGLSDLEIGTAASFYALAMVVATYVFGMLADRIGRLRLITAGMLVSSASFLLFLLSSDFTSFLLIRILNGAAISVYASALMAYAHDAGHRLGKLSAFESLGAALGLVAIGFAAAYSDITSMFLIGAALFAAAFFVSLRMKHARFSRTEIVLFPRHVLRQNLPVYASMFVRHSAASAIWVFWSLYLLQLGGDLLLVGVASAVNCVTQFIFMLAMSDKMRVKVMIPLGTLLSALTFFAFGAAADIWQIMLLEVPLGVSWSLIYVGSVRWVADSTKEKATGLGMLGSVLNLSMLVGPVIATVVVQFGGYRSVMFAAAAITFAAFLIFDVLSKRKRSQK